MGMKPRPKFLLHARPVCCPPPWWPKGDGTSAVRDHGAGRVVPAAWVTVHEDGWTVGRDPSYALPASKVRRAKELFLDEYAPDENLPGVDFEFVVEAVR